MGDRQMTPHGLTSEHLAWPVKRIVAWIRLFRCEQWVKNGFVLVPLLFGGKALQLDAVTAGLSAFASFSLAASGAYAVNDAVDAREDTIHPRKKSRPVASGQISAFHAMVSAPILWGLAVLIADTAGNEIGLLVTSYILLTMLYTFYLKRIPVVDVVSLACGYVLRVIGGAQAVDTEVTPWLLAVTFFIAMMLGFGKRRSELALSESGAYAQVSASMQITSVYVSISAAVTITAYALYAIESETAYKSGGRLIFTLPFVVCGLFRYLWLVNQEEMTSCPTEIFLTDRPIQLSVVAWLAAVALILYL